MTVLKPGGGDQRRRVNELAKRNPADRLGGLAFAFQPGLDTLLDPLLRCLRVVDDLLLLSDLPLQLGHVFADARLLLRSARGNSRWASARRYLRAWSCPSGESIQARCLRSRATAESKEPLKSMYSRDPRRNGNSASGSSRQGDDWLLIP